MKARDLAQAYEQKLLHDWDQTAPQIALMNNLILMVDYKISAAAGGKPKKPRFKSYLHYHPYRTATKKDGMRITGNKSGMSLLRMLGNAMVRR